jgi:hypothetical protein
VQRLVVGSFSAQLSGLLSSLPADAVAQLTDTLAQLAGNIARHGQQVRRMKLMRMSAIKALRHTGVSTLAHP